MPWFLNSDRTRVVALTAATAVLAACAHLGTPEAGPTLAQLPDHWSIQLDASSATTTATDLAQWWDGLRDPQLTALITQALRANMDVRSATAALRQARAQRDLSAAGLWPQLDASLSAQRARSGGNEASNSFAAGLDASWEVDIFGERHDAVAAADSDTLASQANLAQVQVSMAGEVALDYIALRSLQSRLQIADSSLVSQLDTLQIARWRTQAGLISALDVEQAFAASELVRAQSLTLQTSLEQSFNALAVLTGQAPGTLQRQLLAAPVPVPPPELSLPAATLRQRPDVNAAEHRVSAALARRAQADAARFPSFQISGSIGLRSLALSSLGDGASVLSSLLAGVSVPLFDGGAARAQLRVQDATVEQARLAYQGTVLNALREVEDALAAVRGDSQRLLRLQSAADAAANADAMARQRYASGLVDFQTVLETQRSHLSSQDSVALAVANLSADHVRLYKALGGGWRPDGKDGGLGSSNNANWNSSP